MIVFQLPKSPIVDANGYLSTEWLLFFNKLSRTGDVVVATDLPTLNQLFSDMLISQAPLNRQQPEPVMTDVQRPMIAPDLWPDTPTRDYAAQKLHELEMWSLS